MTLVFAVLVLVPLVLAVLALVTLVLVTLALALVVAVAIKIVGALLIGALLIIPATAARPLARSPETMALFATSIGASSGLIGILLSAQYDTPAGPTIICVAAGAFFLSWALAPLIRLKTL